jgi:hypothetical protein
MSLPGSAIQMLISELIKKRPRQKFTATVTWNRDRDGDSHDNGQTWPEPMNFVYHSHTFHTTNMSQDELAEIDGFKPKIVLLDGEEKEVNSMSRCEALDSVPFKTQPIFSAIPRIK